MTAVEWLEQEFVKLESTIGVHGQMYELLEQAKEMEKEQIMNAFTQGDLFAEDYFNAEKPNIDCAENYYNETFKSETIVTEFKDGTIKVETFKSE
jgi:hypothetical protein